MYTVRIITEDELEVTFECGPDEDVISAGLEQDVILLASCRQGGCATCKAECVEGDYELGGVSVQALPPDEEEDGVVLLCRTYPRSDVVFHVPYVYERISFEKIKIDWQGEIVSVERLSSNVARLVVQPSDRDTSAAVRIPFIPGQYLEIEAPGAGVSRSYSMATTSNDPQLEFLIRLLPNGRFSDFLSKDAKPGMTVDLKGPFGTFNIHENGLRPRYFVAGGTGLSPVLSMIRHMRLDRHPNQAKLFFGVTNQHEAFYLAELKRLEDDMPNLRVYVSIMHPEPGWDGGRGSVVDELARHLTEAKSLPDLYLCGPPGMIEAVFAVAGQRGVPKEQIYLEKFLASGQAQAAE